jgi:ribosomal protein L11 methylase PrmA
MELHPWFYEMEPHKYDRIIDIGAAEGYYAVGMALRTGSKVDAYEAAPVARRICRSIAKLNALTDQVRVHSYCSQKDLLKLDGLRCFVLSDCEGFEVSLFSEDVIRALACSDLIVELHDQGKAPVSTVWTCC